MSDSFVSLNKTQESIKRTTSSHHRPPPPPPRTTSSNIQQASQQQSSTSQHGVSQTRSPVKQQNSRTSINSERKVSLPSAMNSTNLQQSGRDVVCAENEEITLKYLMAERNYDNLKKVARKGRC